MYEITLAKKYARALFGVARENKNEDVVYGELKYVLSVIGSDKGLTDIWLDRRISRTDKKNILSRLFKDKIGELSKRFLEITINKKREIIFRYVIEYFYLLLVESKNILNAEIKSAFELSNEEINRLKDKLMSVVKAKGINIDLNVDKSLIGGLVVKIGNQVYDGSVSNKLKEIRELVIK